MSDARHLCVRQYEERFTWLYYNVLKNGYMCTLCELFRLSSDEEYSGKGVKLSDHPMRQLEKHNNSKKHNSGVQYAQFNCRVDVLQQLQNENLAMREINRKVLKKLFRCLYFIFKNVGSN